MDAAGPPVSIDLAGFEEKEGLPVEAFAKVQEIFNNVDWLDPNADATLNVPQQITASNILQESLEAVSVLTAETGSSLQDSSHEKLKSESSASENNIRCLTSVDMLQQIKVSNAIQKILDPMHSAEIGSLLLDSTPENLKSELKDSEKITRNPTLMDQGKQATSSFESSLDSLLVRKKIEPQELRSALQRPAQPKIISQRGPQTSLSAPVSYSNSLQGSPVPISRYHSAPSALGITALLHDHAASSSEEVKHPLTVSLPSPTSLAAISSTLKPVQPTNVPAPPTSTPPLPPFSLQSSMDAPTSQSMPLPISSVADSSPTQHPRTAIQSSLPPPPPPPPPLGASPSFAIKSSCTIPSPLPPPPSLAGVPSLSVKSSFSTPPPPPSPPPPPPPPPPSTLTGTFPSSSIRDSFSTPPPPPPPPPSHGIPSVLPVKNSAVTSAPPPSPPPPPHSRFASGPNKTSSAPAPPPPPALFVNGLTKVGSSTPQSSSVVSNGNVPPIPGPPSGAPFSAKGRGLSRIGSRNLAQPKKSNLKPYHWLKLTRAMSGSLWAEAQKSDEATKAPEFDMSELESLFSTALPNSDHGSTGGKSNRRASGPKSEKVQLIELRRAYNCEIMLSKVKVPIPDLMSLVLALDESALDIDQVENLIKFCPTKEETELLKGYGGNKENLGKCEQFFLELMKVPRVESKLRVFSFKIQFRCQVSDLRKNLNVVNSASEVIRNSVKLKRIMQTILSLGNALNHGTARGSAIGFRLDSLLKLTDTRARNNKMTLMHYLCKVLAEKLPELLDFHKDLVNLEASTKIQLKYLAEEMQAISKGLEKVVQELTASENDGPVSEKFCKILNEFLGHAEAEVRSLASLYTNVGRNADALAQYFGEDPARCPFEQVVSTLFNFVRMFVRAHEENCKQIELEKKRAQKEEEEKLKLNAPKKGPLHWMQTAIKSGNVK